MKVNYKSDFELTIQLTAGGVDVAAPSWDWQLRFYTFDRQAVYTVAYIDGKAERCAVNSDGTITAYFDKHGLMPGALRCEFVNLVPDSHYTHDTQVQVDPVELGVELWRGASDGGMDAVTLELAGQVLAEVQALAADLQQKAESGYFDGEPGPQGPQGPPGPAGPGLLVVTLTPINEYRFTPDKTFAEALAAHTAGRRVVFSITIEGQTTMIDVYWSSTGDDGIINAMTYYVDADVDDVTTLEWAPSRPYVNLIRSRVQHLLTFDDTPTSGSTNPVTSGGVFTALQGKADTSTTYTKTEVNTALQSKADRRRVVDNSQDASVVLAADTYNQLGTTDAPVVSLPASYTAADEFLYCFTCATDACVVTLPQGVVLADCCDDFSEVAAGVWFQVSIMDGVAAYLCVIPQN